MCFFARGVDAKHNEALRSLTLMNTFSISAILINYVCGAELVD